MRGIVLLCLVACCAGCGPSRSDVDSRAIALWILERGGRLTISERTVEISRKEQLPDGRFEIVQIDLNGATIQDSDLINFIGLRNLENLNLHQTDVTDEGIRHLAAVKSLKQLELSYTRITDKGLGDIEDLSNLASIYLYGTQISDRAAKEFADLTGAKVYR